MLWSLRRRPPSTLCSRRPKKSDRPERLLPTSTARSTAHGTALLVCGDLGQVCTAELQQAFGGAVRFNADPAGARIGDVPPPLVLGSGRGFDNWAWERHIPALSFDGVTLGPLTLPGHIGCG